MTLSDFEKIIPVLFPIVVSLSVYLLLRNHLHHRISRKIFLIFNTATAILASYFILNNQLVAAGIVVGLTLLVGCVVTLVIGTKGRRYIPDEDDEWSAAPKMSFTWMALWGDNERKEE